jgi:hypothetical protein
VTKPIYAPFVLAGMAMLDEKLPGWDDAIDLEELDLGSTDSCIVGQLERKYDLEDHVGLGTEAYGYRKYPLELGFEKAHYTQTYDGLTRAWKRQIVKRRQAKQEVSRG